MKKIIVLLLFSGNQLFGINCPPGKVPTVVGSLSAPSNPANSTPINIGDYSGVLYDYMGIQVQTVYTWVSVAPLKSANCPASLTQTQVTVANSGSTWNFTWKIFSGTYNLSRSTTTSSQLVTSCQQDEEVLHYLAWKLQSMHIVSGRRRLKVGGMWQLYNNTTVETIQEHHARKADKCIPIP